MVDKRVLVISPTTAVLYSVLSMILSWFIYDYLCKSKLIKNDTLFLLVILILLTILSFCLTKIFGPKFAFLSVGLIIGSNMFANVFTIIIPNQMNIINSSKKSQKFDMSLSLSAKQRSLNLELSKLEKMQEKFSQSLDMVSPSSENDDIEDRLVDLEDAIKSMDLYRNQVNQSILSLKEKLNDLELEILNIGSEEATSNE